jgi:folate-binding protein YgfZ
MMGEHSAPYQESSFMPYASLLEDRSIISVKGAEARSFLQGLISNDMEECAPGRGIYAALLTPQGKILFEFFVVEHGDRFLLDCSSARAAELIKRLTFYRLRAKIEIAAAPELTVTAVWNGGPQAVSEAGIAAFADPRLPTLGVRLIGPLPLVQSAIAGAQTGDYRSHLLRFGVPDSGDVPPDSVFALDAGFEELRGVDFRKGCYVGQEVTSRMKHRASARRRFLIAEVEGDLPPPGTKLEASGREVGTLATGTDGRALALVRLDRVAEASTAGETITAMGQKVSLQRPSWLQV